MQLAVLQTSLPGNFGETLEQIAALGFTQVDLTATQDRPGEHLTTLAATGLIVGCMALGRGLPEGHTLDATSLTLRRETVKETQEQINDAARLGARYAYLVPGTTSQGLPYFTEACQQLAAFAATRMIRLCVEPIPGRALATCQATLSWLDAIDEENLGMLLDVGHCLITEEDTTQMIVKAGSRLGYVHLDDNDSVRDVHWPLLTGRLTEEMLEAVLIVLDAGESDIGVALELNPANYDPLGALAESKRIIDRILAKQEPKT
jgi:sugar phosphate isomerase/epimerase